MADWTLAVLAELYLFGLSIVSLFSGEEIPFAAGKIERHVGLVQHFCHAAHSYCPGQLNKSQMM
jgi:hypothetical protein